jgi:hypothetical protein
MKKHLFVMLEILINHLFVMVNKMNPHLYANLSMVKNHLYADLMMKMPLSDVQMVRNPMKHSFVELMVDPMVKKLSSDVLVVRIIQEIIMSLNSIYPSRFFYIPCTDRSEIFLFFLIIIPFF